MVKSILIVFIVFLCFLSITTANTHSEYQQLVVNSTQDTTNFVFQDSLHIGECGKYKVQIKQEYLDDSESLLSINLYEKNIESWMLIQSLIDTTYDVQNIDVMLNSLNANVWNDLSFQCALAGRGANEIRKYYLFDKENNEFVSIKNSPDYPNISYDADSNCFMSVGYSGTIMIEFLHLEEDSLVSFGSSELDDIGVCL